MKRVNLIVSKRKVLALVGVALIASVVILAVVFQKETTEITKIVHSDKSVEYVFEDRKAKAQYSIYQLAMSDEAGGCCYGIELPSGKLIMIDSGYQSDYSYIRDFILNHGGQVDSWFITHPHFDHVGGLIQLSMEEKQAEIEHEKWGITIDKIFYAPFTKDFFENEEDGKNIQELNKAVLFNEFTNYQNDQMNASDKQIEFIPMNVEDRYTVENIVVTCMNSFNDKIYDVNANSLVLQFQIESIEFLVTGDITDVSIKEMSARWGENNELWDIDIIQIPHHGYIAGITSDSLYRQTSPEIAFLDCSKEEFESNACNIQEHVAWVENLGIDIIKRFNGDNKIIIK